MVGGCNDCLFDNNTVTRFLFETADSGAYYDGRTWLHRGNVISNNVFEDIRHTDPQRDNKGGMAAAVYFDDMLSGNSGKPIAYSRPRQIVWRQSRAKCWTTVINNTFRRCDTGVLLGGGRHHLVQGNHFEAIDTQCVWIDARKPPRCCWRLGCILPRVPAMIVVVDRRPQRSGRPQHE
jgi:hypothetical protein